MDFEEWWQSELKINRWDRIIGNRALARRAWNAAQEGMIDPKQLAFVPKMPSVELFIPIIPKAQQRDRIAVVGGHARSYKAKSQVIEEDNLRALIYRELPTHVLWPIKTAIRLFVGVALPIPASTPKRVLRGILDGSEPMMHTKKPDVTNLIKNLEDIGNGVLWQDDRQIWELRVKKYYSDNPGWHLYLEW